MRSYDGIDLKRPARQAPPEVAADDGLVVEDPETGWCGAVVACDKAHVSLEDRHGKVRVFPLGVFLLDGAPVTLTRPVTTVARPTRSASGSRLVTDHSRSHRARVARASRIWVEGKHDAELVERVWGHDLRVEGVVVEPLDGIDELPALLMGVRGHRVGVLVDHLVEGSKESRIVAEVTSPNVLVTGHPYVDIWQAVKPASVGIDAWPVVERGRPWKEGVCAALGWGEPWEGWRRILASVGSYTDLEVPLLNAVERLIDFVTEP